MTRPVPSKQLVTLRQQAREIYPEARWLPGDACPVGMPVVTDGGHRGVVEGEEHGIEHFRYWWRVRMTGGPKVGQTVLEYPSSLRCVR